MPGRKAGGGHKQLYNRRMWIVIVQQFSSNYPTIPLIPHLRRQQPAAQPSSPDLRSPVSPENNCK